MSVDSLIFWLFVVAWVVVAAIFVLGIVPRIVGEVRRISGHVSGLIAQSPLPLQLAKAEADLTRIETALERLPRLQARAGIAVMTLRAARFAPAGLRPLTQRIEREIAAFRATAG